jgi:non-canonical purine NTP pyrophosphatase (RdgB/HAM1 family)
MKSLVFITGNLNKADQLAKYLEYPITHYKVDLEEIQSLDLQEVLRHKVYQAYTVVQRPVLVEDVSLEFTALGKLPGTFIRWFLDELSPEGLCRLLDGKERTAIARSMFGYFDGTEEQYFEGSLKGVIAEKPIGKDGYGWDNIFIPEGYEKTRAELNKEDYQTTYLKIRPIQELKTFLEK